jgi:membrane-bound lytic murein transglycosylase A
VDPLDAFVLQTEGGGVVLLDDGTRLALDHAGTNQRDHVRIGKFLDDKLPPGPRDWPVMEAYLRSLPERQMRDLLEKNPRYAFFRVRPAGSAANKDAVVGPNTAIGLPAVPGRTIATDGAVVPRGGLAFLMTQLPVFDAGATTPRWKESRRFVLDEDAGGGIKGARIDFYFGTGDEAGREAGVMKQPGRIFYLFPRGTPSSK